MGVEAAMGQADLFHDVGDARAVVPAAPGSARGGPDDPFVGDLLAAWPGSAGGSAHMMIIKYQSNAECKKETPRAIGEEVYSHLGQVRHRSEVVEYRVEQHAAKLGGRHRSSVVELSIRNPARPALISAGRCVSAMSGNAYDDQRRGGTILLTPPLTPRRPATVIYGGSFIRRSRF